MDFRALAAALFLPVLLNPAAASAQTLVSREATDRFVQHFQESSESQQRDWQKFKRLALERFNNEDGIVQAWVQPANKKEPCKVHAADPSRWWDDRENRIFWDGACQDGFAHGLGREFLIRNGEISSWLSSYKQPNTPPQYYLVTHYDRQIVQLRAQSGQFAAGLDYKIGQEGDIRYLSISKTLLDGEENRLYMEQRASGGDRVAWTVVLPNRNGYLFTAKLDPSGRETIYATRDGTGAYVGYTVAAQEVDGRMNVRHFENSSAKSPQAVTLPPEYLAHLSDTAGKVTERLRLADKMLEESFVAISIYKRRICEGAVAVDFVSPEIYGRICLDDGELGAFSKLVAQSQEQQKTRHAQMREELDRRRREAATQTAESERNGGRHDERQKPEYQGFGRALSEFASSMAAMQDRSAQFTQNYMNSLNWPGLSAPASGHASCVLVANVVNCRRH